MNLRKFIKAFSFLFLITVIFPSCRQEKKFKIGISQCSQDDWREKMNQEIMREAMFHDNVEIEIRSAHDSNEKQIADIRYFVDNGFDMIIAAPNEAAPITPVIDEVMAKGIPVMIFDRSVNGNNFTAFQGADNDSIGLQAAQYIRSIAGPKARIIEIFGNPGSTPARERHRGFDEGKGDMTIIGSGQGNWNYDQAYQVAESLLNVHPEADAIFAHNDRMALAASDAASKLRLKPYIIGIDAAPEIGMKAVSEGKIDATFIYPTEGYRLLRTALAILEGKPYERISELPEASAVDKSNADILLLQNKSLKEETEKIQFLKSQVDTYWNRHSIQTTFLYVTLIILALLFVFMFLFLRSFWKQKQQQKLLVEQNSELEKQRDNEKQLNEQLQEATRSKLMFFTNVSHDLRTPLTLIAEPVRQLSSSTNLSDRQHTLMRIADKNVRILKRLINQVLDFRKYENGHMKPVLTEVDIRNLVTEWTEAFNAVARKRDIKLSLDITGEGPEHIALDVEKIESVFFNLLSNAFKYTPDNGRIRVSLAFAADSVCISVDDTGRGISADDLSNIFDRFYQVDKVHPNGSGIGLSLAKAFVEMHGGTIEVESEPSKGSIFSVTLPIKHVAKKAVSVESHISDSDIASELDRVYINTRVENDENTDNKEDDASKPILLIIDDNPDILTLVSSLLSEQYQIITAPNGSEGVRLAAKYVPDLVVCDVMMPVMDGLECCRRIKTEVSTSHIPVLMLTACSMDEQRVQGYEAGADGYVSKPFNSEVLLARCKSLIENRRRIKDVLKSSYNPVQPDKAEQSKQAPSVPVSEIDNGFYLKFLEIFRQKMSDADINVDSLAAELGLGRSQFYRKIKALTNYSPVELIRNLRLKEARNMLLTTDKTVSEIAYAVGFSTPAYFTKCYREAFAETPSDTRSNLTKTP